MFTPDEVIIECHSTDSLSRLITQRNERNNAIPQQRQEQQTVKNEVDSSITRDEEDQGEERGGREAETRARQRISGCVVKLGVWYRYHQGANAVSNSMIDNLDICGTSYWQRIK